MTNRPRHDTPGSLHHVMNGAVGRRPLFESAGDIRRFLSLVEQASDEGDVLVHSYAVLTTHYHFIFGSPNGRLSAAMRDIQSGYARPFNEAHGRPGPLMRSRYLSKRIDTERYFATVVRYIDQNPVEAGLVARPSDYEFGSARAYELGEGPRWLARGPVERLAMSLGFKTRFSGALYRGCFGSPLATDERANVLDALKRGNTIRDLGPLFGAHPSVQAELKRRAMVADGVTESAPLLDRATLSLALAQVHHAHGAWSIRCGLRERCGWTLIDVALQSRLCGETQEAIASRLGCSRSTVRDTLQAFDRLKHEPDVVARVGLVARALPADVRARLP